MDNDKLICRIDLLTAYIEMERSRAAVIQTAKQLGPALEQFGYDPGIVNAIGAMAKNNDLDALNNSWPQMKITLEAKAKELRAMD